MKRSHCHLNAYSPVWVLSGKLSIPSCLFKSSHPENLLPHFGHKKYFSPVCFSHFSSIHLFLGSSCQTFCTHSFSTVGVLLWLFKPFDEEKLLSHLVHLNAFSHVWVPCVVFPFFLNTFSSVWIFLWIFSWIFTYWGFSCVFQVPWFLEALATLCALKLFLSCVVPSSFFNSHDPEKLMPDFVHP